MIPAAAPSSDDGRQKTDGRRQKAEGRGQMTEDRGQKAEDRRFTKKKEHRLPSIVHRVGVAIDLYWEQYPSVVTFEP